MKRLSMAAAVAGLLVFAGMPQLQAGFVLNFNENGTASYVDDGNGTLINGYTSLSGSATRDIIADPSGSGLGNVLAYLLPEEVISGEVGIGEPPDGHVGDVLFFTTTLGINDGAQDANLMVFYSGDVSTGLLADVGLPGGAAQLPVGAIEDVNGNFTYVAAPNTYNGNSPDAPEPVSMLLFGSGLLGVAFTARKRRKTA